MVSGLNEMLYSESALKDSDWLIGVFRATTELHKTSNPEVIFKKPDCSTALVVQGASDWLVSVPER